MQVGPAVLVVRAAATADAMSTRPTPVFDYDLQVWTVNGIVQACGHPDSMRPSGEACCNAWAYKTLPIAAARAWHESFGA